jgi:hypothetical protein
VLKIASPKDQQNFNIGTYTFSTDGVNLHDSNSLSVWPLFITLNQLPPEQQKCMLIGLWYGQNAPNMNTFLSIFKDEANLLANEGLDWKDSEGTRYKTKLFPACFTADSPARAKVLNMKSHCGYKACYKCKHGGKLVAIKEKKKYVRYPSKKIYSKRSSFSVSKSMKKALKINKKLRLTAKKKSVEGFFGPSIITCLPKFKIPNNIAFDPMHACFLGISKALFTLWSEATGKDYYLALAKIDTVSNKLIKICRPSNCTRNTRPLNQCKQYKSSEWCLWLFFDAFPVLEKTLPDVYLKHFALFSSAVYILSQQIVSENDITVAENFIQKFVTQYIILYKKSNCTFNSHIITHLADDVRNFGPLWTHSCDIYESANGDLSKLATGPNNIPQQIAKKQLMYSSINVFLQANNVQVSGECMDIVQNLFVGLHRKNAIRVKNTTVLGFATNSNLSEAEKQSIQNINMLDINFTSKFHRAIVSGIVITSHSYSLDKRNNDSCIETKDGKYYQIESILKNSENSEILIIAKEIITKTIPDSFPLHIKRISQLSEKLIAMSTSCLLHKLYIMNVGNYKYFSKFPDKRYPN